MRAAFMVFGLSLGVLTTSGANADPNLAMIPTGDAAMARAVEKARATLPGFIEKSRHPASDMEGFGVKVGLGPRGGEEFFWLSPFSVVGDMLSGVLANEPEVIAGYRKGETVKVPLAQVSDWMYFDHGKMVGNYSACVLLAREGQDSLAAFEKQYGIDCAAQ